MTIASTPSLADFTASFVTGQMGVPVAAQNATAIGNAYQVAIATVNLQLACIQSPIYTLAVYNLAASFLVNFAQDPTPLPTGYPTLPSTNPQSPAPLPYWTGLRAQWRINDFTAGVVNSSSDEGTSVSLTVPEAFQNLTIGDLQRLKDVYGRTYLAIAQDAGTLWGLS